MCPEEMNHFTSHVLQIHISTGYLFETHISTIEVAM